MLYEVITIACSSFHVCDPLKIILGDSADIEQIIPSKTSPHQFQPNRKTSELINKADKIILVGGGFESFLETSVDKIAPAKKILTTDIAGRKVILSTPHHHDEEEGNKEQHNEDIKTPDPHLWLDFSLWKNTMLRTSYEAAKDLHIDIPKNSVTSFLGKMDELENLGLNNLSSLRGKSLISTHLAYKYWERKYGLKNYGIKGTNDTSQASLKSLTELETLIKQKKIKAIFVEPNDANKEVKALKASLSKADVEINVIPIYLGTTDNSDYFSIMKENILKTKRNL